MGFEHLNGTPVFADFRSASRPDVCFPIFGAADNVFGVFAEGGVNLGAGVFVAFEFNLQALIPKIVYPDARIVASDQDLYIAVGVIGRVGDRLDAGDFAAFSIFAMGGADMNLRLVL